MEVMSYIRSAEAVDRDVRGAPKSGREISKTFLAYLKLIYSPEEAAVIQYLNMPNKFKTDEQVAQDALKLHRFGRTVAFETARELWKAIDTENKGL